MGNFIEGMTISLYKRYYMALVVLTFAIVLFCWIHSTLSLDKGKIEKNLTEMQLLVNTETGAISDIPSYTALNQEQEVLRQDVEAYTPFKSLSIGVMTIILIGFLTDLLFYSTTKINFLNVLIRGDDNQYDSEERKAAIGFLKIIMVVVAIVMISAMFLTKL